MEREHFVGKVSLRALIVKDKKIFLCRGVGDSLWQLPGGRLNKEEEPVDGMKRELLEELGVDIEVGKIFHTQFFYHKKTGVPQVMLVFRCTLKDGQEPHIVDPTDLEETRWISKEDIKSIQFFEDCLQACTRAFMEGEA